MSVYVLKPKAETGTKLLLFGDYHGSFEGVCEDAVPDAVKIYSPEFLSRLAQSSRSAVIVSEAFYEPALVTRLIESPALLRSHLAELATVPQSSPLNQFLVALLEPCLLKQHKVLHAALPKSARSLLRQACPYDNIRVLWGDVRQIRYADAAVHRRFYWESLLVTLLILMGPHSMHEPLERMSDNANVLREGLDFVHEISGLEPSRVLHQLMDTVRSLVFGVGEPALAPKEHMAHSLLWKQLLKIPESEQAVWTRALAQYCDQVEPDVPVRESRFRAETERFFEALAAWMSDPDTALLRWPSDETELVALVCGALLADCYAMLRLRGKYPDADRAVFYMGQAHIQEMARFYTGILGSHTLEFKHVNPAGSRCLELRSAVRL